MLNLIKIEIAHCTEINKQCKKKSCLLLHCLYYLFVTSFMFTTFRHIDRLRITSNILSDS